MANRGWSRWHHRFHRHLLEQPALLPAQAHLLVAVSGGQDSMALLRLLLDLRHRHHWTLHVWHGDHGWHGGSGAIASDLAAWCQTQGHTLIIDRADDGEANTETMAREWRASTLLAHCQALGCDAVTGHTATDRAETVLINLARGSDLWLHTADVPGSHVLLRLEKGSEAEEQEILDAAHLAIWFSPQRGIDRAPVHVAARKHVHKPKGAKAGLVTLSGGRILQVRVQQERLDRLLRSAR